MANTLLPQRPDIDPRREHDANPGQRHEDDLFRHFEKQMQNPTGSSIAEDANIDRAQASMRDDLRDAESSAAAGAATNIRQGGSENTPNYYYKPRVGAAKSQTRREINAAKIRSSGRTNKRRGLFIGLGAGGGILSVVAGFSALLPLKLPGIMDTIIGDAGKRVEKVVERRAERILFMYILRGSTIALKNGAVIATGNPIGDLFANIRTSNFEKNLKTNTGLEFEPGENKTVKLVHNGQDLGNVKNTDDILKILEKGENGKSLSRADIRKIVRTQIPAWRFWKRAKFVNWLRIKYNIPRWGAREQNADEKDEDYEKSVKKEHIQQVETANMQNLTDFVDCAAEAGDCVDRTDEGGKMTEQTNKAIAEATEELAEEGSKKTSSTVVKLIISKLTASSVGAYIPYVGWVDIGARLVHGIGKIIDDDILQKKHAEYIKRSSAVLGATYAGYSDQTKAGDNQTGTVGMFSDNLTGWEDSVTYGIVQSSALGSPITGETLTSMERVNESIELNDFAQFVKLMFGTVGWVGRAPLELWYYTVSQAFDLVGALLGDAVGWIVEHTPAKALLAQLGPIMGDIFEGIMKFIGMYIDPLAVGAKLALYIHQGFLSTFNDKAHEDGMRRLTKDQALAFDNEIRQDRIADLKTESFFDRVLNLDNERSLATTMVASLPTTSFSNPVGGLATGSIRMVGDIPANLARAASGTVYAGTAADTISEEYFGINPYGATEADMSAEVDAGAYSPTATCPENRDNAFNHCKVDRDTVTSMNCVFVKCADMYGNQQQAGVIGDPLFAYGAQGPLYGPDAVQPKSRVLPNFDEWLASSGGMLIAILPIGALEISRRRLA